MVERIEPGPRMSHVVKHNGVAYLAGMTAEDASLDFEGQMRQVLAKTDASLALAGTDKSRLLTATNRPSVILRRAGSTPPVTR